MERTYADVLFINGQFERASKLRCLGILNVDENINIP